MDDLVVKRWVRFGHDRLYVHTSDGQRLGYWDNRAHTAIVEDEGHREAVEAAGARHVHGVVERVAPIPYSAVPLAAPPIPTTAAPDHRYFVSMPSAAERCTDLAATRPGAAARERAVALRQAAPVRTFVNRVIGAKTDERAWRIGADGEESVAARLGKLGERWKCLHAVPVGDKGSDIDHVVIGPGGVFTINTKHHPNATIWVGGDTVLVNGQRQPYVRNSRFEARRAAKFLTSVAGETVTAMGLIALVNIGDLTVKKQPVEGDVYVLTRWKLLSWLEARPQVLTDTQVERLYAVARRSTTWHT